MFRKRLKLLALIVLLTILMPQSVHGEVQYVTTGWTTTENGYFLQTQDARDLLAATKQYKLESDAWQGAYIDLRAEFQTSMETVSADIKRIEESINASNRAQKTKTFWNVSIPVLILTGLLLAK